MEKSFLQPIITVAGKKTDPRSFPAKKYCNANDLVYQVKTCPSELELTPLAQWLVEHCPANVASPMPHPQSKYRVRVLSGLTRAERIMLDAQNKNHCNGVTYSTQAAAISAAENVIKCYGDSLDKPQQIDDWAFGQIRTDESDEEFWNRNARLMIAAGAKSVKIGAAILEINDRGDLQND